MNAPINILTLLLAATIFTAQEPAQSAPQTTEMETFRVDSANFSFQYPASFLSQQKKVEESVQKKLNDPAADKDTKQVATCLTLPFSAQEKTDDNISSISVMKLDAQCANLELSDQNLMEFASGIVKGISKTMRNEFAPPAAYALDGHKAVLLHGNLYSASGRATALVEACVAVNTTIYCWQLSSRSASRMNDLALLSITFDGHKATRIVPAELLNMDAAKPETP